MEIKIGDFVRLKSGGPVMTVNFINYYDYHATPDSRMDNEANNKPDNIVSIECVWFVLEHSGQAYKEIFFIEALNKVNSQNPAVV